MGDHFKLEAEKGNTALVIALPPDVKGLFNPEIHGLVRDVSEKLHDVYVTYALSSGFAPNLRDAMAAARFMGCDSAVVVSAGTGDEFRFGGRRTAGDWMISTAPVFSALDASAVAQAYVSAVEETGRAA